jgi:hypothetical protein
VTERLSRSTHLFGVGYTNQDGDKPRNASRLIHTGSDHRAFFKHVLDLLRKHFIDSTSTPCRMDQCILYQLPNEILQDKLMVILSQSDLAAIRQASTLLYDLSTRALYRRIYLTRPSQVVKCCKTLVDTKFHVEVTHEFVIDIPRSVCLDLFVMASHAVSAQSNRSAPFNDPTSEDHSEALVLPKSSKRSYQDLLRCSGSNRRRSQVSFSSGSAAGSYVRCRHCISPTSI